MHLKHILLAVLVAAIWGCNFIFIKLGVAEIPPLFLCAARFLLASFPAIFFVKFPKASLKLVLLYAWVMFGLQFAFMFSSFAVGMSAGMASLIGQTQIFFSVLFAVVFLGERPGLWQIAGGLIAGLGIFYVGLHVNSSITLGGLLFIMAAASMWGVGNLIVKKLGRINMVSLVVWCSFLSCLPLFISSILIEGTSSIQLGLQHVSWLGVVSLLYIVFASTWLGYGAWNYLLSLYPVSTIVPFTLLVPVFGLLCSIILLHETLEPWKIAAAAIVISGLTINFIGPKFFVRRKQVSQDQPQSVDA